VTLSQLLDYVKNRHREPTTSGNWTDVEIFSLVTARSNEVLGIIGLIEATDTDTSVASTQAYDFPTDAVALKAVLYDGNLMQPITFREWEVEKSGGETPEGTPSKWVNWNRQMLLVPIPSTAGDTITIYYEKEHAVITQATDTWSIPSVLHYRIADGVLADMYAKDLNVGMAKMYEDKWLGVHMDAFYDYKAKIKRRGRFLVTGDSDTMMETEFGIS